jgi:hypothetical protein
VKRVLLSLLIVALLAGCAGSNKDKGANRGLDKPKSGTKDE